MNFIKILGGIGAGLLAGAGLIIAGKTGLGKSESENGDAEPEAPAEDTATATEPVEVESEEIQETPAEEAAE